MEVTSTIRENIVLPVGLLGKGEVIKWFGDVHANISNYVSNKGRVFTRNRTLSSDDPKAWRIREFSFSNSAAPLYASRLVATIVAEAFVPKTSPDAKHVHHIDGNILNNNAKNLEWREGLEKLKPHFVEVFPDGTTGKIIRTVHDAANRYNKSLIEIAKLINSGEAVNDSGLIIKIIPSPSAPKAKTENAPAVKPDLDEVTVPSPVPFVKDAVDADETSAVISTDSVRPTGSDGERERIASLIAILDYVYAYFTTKDSSATIGVLIRNIINEIRSTRFYAYYDTAACDQLHQSLTAAEDLISKVKAVI